LALRRLVFEPGDSIANHHHPGAHVVCVESGALTYGVVEGVVEVRRAARDGTPGSIDRLGPDDETVLNEGDALFEGVVHSARNDGEELAVVWVASVVEVGQPFSVFHGDRGTPAP